MTTSEFSNEFDVLYNNITSNQAPGLDEYEKSVFLTKAQDEILKSYFDPSLNKAQEGFDGGQRRQIDFSKVTKVHAVSSVTASAKFVPQSNAKSVTLPTDALMIVNERIEVTGRGTGSTWLTVVPIQYSEFDRLMSKPFKRPLKWQAWRVIAVDTSVSADIVPGIGDTISKYEARYVKRPKPIILATLEGGLSIGGASNTSVSECELDEILHREILQRAVEMAKAAYTGDLTSQVALGQSSQTPIGAVTQSR